METRIHSSGSRASNDVGWEIMTEIPSQNKQILDKLDSLTESTNKIKEDIAGIKQQIEYQPRIDKELHNAIDQRFDYNDERISKLEDSQTWATRLIIGTILTSLISIILTLFKH